MRVLVTGATGNLGTSLLPRLAAHPDVDEVVGLARRVPDDAGPAHRWVSADLLRDELDAHLRGVDVLVHLAWLVQPTRRPRVLWSTNVVATRRLLAAAGGRVGAVIHASSVGAYSPRPRPPGRKRRGVPAAAVDEHWPTDGVAGSAYSIAKAYVERCLDTLERDRPEVRIVRLRPSVMAGAHSATHVRRLFLGTLVPRGILEPGRLPVVPDLPGVGVQMTHVDDVADAVVRIVTGDARGAFNLAAEPWMSLGTIADLLGARRLPVPYRIGRAAVTSSWHARLQPLDAGWLDLARLAPALDTSRARAVLGWQPRLDGPQVLRTVLEAVAAGTGAPTPILAPDRLANRLREAVTRQGAHEMRP